MSDDRTTPPDPVTEETPASPTPRPAKQHGDALLDGSGSRQGLAPEESTAEED